MKVSISILAATVLLTVFVSWRFWTLLPEEHSVPDKLPTCQDAQRHLIFMNCSHYYLLPGPDGRTATPDDMSFAEYCELVIANGIMKIDLKCIYGATGCTEVGECLYDD